MDNPYSLRPYAIASRDDDRFFDVDKERLVLLHEIMDSAGNDFLDNPTHEDVDEMSHWDTLHLYEKLLTAIDTWGPTSTAEQVMAAFAFGTATARAISILEAMNASS